jgi:hypothetical protein
MLRKVFLLVSALVLLALGGCKRQASTNISIDPFFQKLVSEDTAVLAVCDVAALKTTALYARHQHQLDSEALNNVLGRTGFDPRRDISKLLLTWNGKDLLIAGIGHFDERQLEAALASSLKRSEYKRQTLFGDERNALMFLDAEHALASSVQGVHHAIDLYEQNTGHVPEEFSESLAQLSKADQIWLVSRGGLPFADIPKRTDVASILSNFAGYVRSTSAGIVLDEGLHLRAEIDCVSEQGSKRMDDGLRGGIGLGRLAARDKQPDLVQLYDAIRVQKDGQRVHVSADLPPALADDLLGRLVKFGFIRQGATR